MKFIMVEIMVTKYHVMREDNNVAGPNLWTTEKRVVYAEPSVDARAGKLPLRYHTAHAHYFDAESGARID